MQIHAKASSNSSGAREFAPVVLSKSLNLPTLSSEERESLRACERVISEHLEAFMEVGRALLIVKTQALYRDEFASFEEYCRHKWGYTKAHAYRLINGAEVVTQLSPMGDRLPQNERQVRPLTGLSPQMAQKAWRRAVEMAGEGEITGKIVKSAVASIVAKRKKRVRKSSQMWQAQVLPLLKRAISATRKNSRDEVSSLMDKIVLFLSIGNRPSPGEESMS